MTLPDDPLELLALLCKHMQSLVLEAGEFEGVLDEFEDFDVISHRLESMQLLGSADPTSRKIEGRLPPGFFLTMQEFLEAPRRRWERPTRFYIHDLDLLVQHDTPTESFPEAVRHYVQAARLFGFLLKAADHIGGVAGDKTCVFLLSSGKIEIRCDYGCRDLIELEGLDAFEAEFIKSELHGAQKRVIIKTALGELFAGASRVPFSAVLCHFANLVDKVRAGYDLYMAEFSFQKVKETIEKEKLDAMVKLNKVFSDIQNQLLAVPAALVLVGSQMQDNAGWSLKNVLIWCGALVFALLMDLLIRNQRHTLSAVKDEIEQQRKQLETKYKNLMGRFNTTYQEINKRHIHQTRLIVTIDALVGVSFLGASVMLLWYSNAFGPFWNAILFFSGPI